MAEYIRRHDLSGKRFGRWTVIEYAGFSKGNSRWTCRCECGATKNVLAKSIVNGTSQSCGCLAKERVTTHGMKGTPEYRCWSGMMTRCNNAKHAYYCLYGGRGIVVCNRWKSFEAFYEDMGPRPSLRHTLDRYPNKDGNYEPGNVRWATQKQQLRNTSVNRLITLNGVTKTVAEWAECVGIDKNRIYSRLSNGWSDERAVFEPLYHAWAGQSRACGRKSTAAQ